MRSAVHVAAIACIAFCAVGAAAQPEDPIKTTQTVIEEQIEAFLHGDAGTAYSFAAPGIKALYPDKDTFFAMVKRNYQPVYHPGNYAFGRSKSVDGGAVIYHEVLITGRDGKDWSAIYELTRQADGSYKINGVEIVPNTTSQGI
jgi:hypothetical protein